MASDAPIGLIDSGIGGLSIWRAIRRLLPAERMAYIADQAYFPYGDKAPEDLCVRTEALTRVLLDKGCKLIVLACNTASVQTLAHVRAVFPDVPFVGVVPVIKTLAPHDPDRHHRPAVHDEHGAEPLHAHAVRVLRAGQRDGRSSTARASSRWSRPGSCVRRR